MTPEGIVGRNLMRLRREKGLTQQALEERSGVSQQYLSALEGGRRNPTVTILLLLARAMGVPVAGLIEGLDQATPKERTVWPRRNVG